LFQRRFTGFIVADPRYNELLGIDKEIETPPDHFQLLGVDYSESDAEVITKHFKQLMSKIQQVKSNKHKGFLELLKEDLRKAKLNLSNADRRKNYLAELEEKKKSQNVEEFREQVESLLILGEIPKKIFDKLIEKGVSLQFTAEEAEKIIDELTEKAGVTVKKTEAAAPEKQESVKEKGSGPVQADPATIQSMGPTSSPYPSLPPKSKLPANSGRHPSPRPPPARRERPYTERVTRPPMAPLQRPAPIASRRPIARPQEMVGPPGYRPSPPPAALRPPVGRFPNSQFGGLGTGKDRRSEFYNTSAPANPHTAPPQHGYNQQNYNQPNPRAGSPNERMKLNSFYERPEPNQGYPAQNEPPANPNMNFPAMYNQAPSQPTGSAPTSPASTGPQQSRFADLYNNQPNQSGPNQSPSGRFQNQYQPMNPGNPGTKQPAKPAMSGPRLADRVAKEPDYRRKLKEVIDTFNRGAKSVRMGYKAHHELQWYFPPKNNKKNAITYKINGVAYDKVFDIEIKMYREAQRFFEESRKLSKEYQIREGVPQLFFDKLEKVIRSLRTYQGSGRDIKVRLLGNLTKTDQLRIWSDFLREMRIPEFSEPVVITE
jgi:hypothetical protein